MHPGCNPLSFGGAPWNGGLSRASFPRGRGEGEGASLARFTSRRLACCSRASNTACYPASARTASHDDRRGGEALEPAAQRPAIGLEVPAPSADWELQCRLLLSQPEVRRRG